MVRAIVISITSAVGRLAVPLLLSICAYPPLWLHVPLRRRGDLPPLLCQAGNVK
jgi:hypothetical protein